jgi:pimeloyl-ACP methyl ester carboxylesterase
VETLASALSQCTELGIATHARSKPWTIFLAQRIYPRVPALLSDLASLWSTLVTLTTVESFWIMPSHCCLLCWRVTTFRGDASERSLLRKRAANSAAPAAAREKRRRDRSVIVTVMRKSLSKADDLRAASKLAVEATIAVTDLVEAMHRTIAEGPAILGKPLARPARALTGVAYKGVRGVTKLVGGSLDRALARLAPLIGGSVLGPQREALLAALNGVVGDYLAETGSPLAIQMRLRQDGQALDLDRDSLRLAFPHATSKLAVLVHGSSMNDLQWTRLGHNHGHALARDLGYTPIGVHYNSGLHVSTNGRALDSLLEQLVDAWPVEVDEIALLGHSMGGLVARSACHYGEGRRWRSKLKKLLCIATPHHGSTLERAGHWLELLIGINRYSAPLAALGRIRSAGVTDLRFGNVLDEDWGGRDRFSNPGDLRKPLALPDGVACFAMAGTTAPKARRALPGDGLVSVNSALGKHSRAALTLAFPEAHQWIAYGIGHVDLLGRIEVYERIRDWFRDAG